MTRDLAIVGAGGHGREALTTAHRAREAGQFEGECLVFDDAVEPHNRDRLARSGLEVTGCVDDLIAAGLDHVIAVGDPEIRRRLAERIGERARPVVLRDPSAVVGNDVRLGPGVMLYAASVCTTNVRIGAHSHLNCGVVVSHDCEIEEFVSLSPGVRLNGAVTVGAGAFLGTGAIVLPGRTIGQGAVVGAGAVVVDDVASGTTVVGTPARPKT